MRSGTWSGAKSLDNVRVTVNGTVRPVRSVTIESGMRDGHPLSDSTVWCVRSTIGWANPAGIHMDAPHNFGPPSSPDGFLEATSWLPKPGDQVVIETGDGALGQWWVQHRGIIDDTSGSFADGTAESTTVDRIDEFGGPVSMWAALSRSMPVADGRPFRQVGMSSIFLLDRMLRRSHDISGQTETGWFATPPKTWQTVGSAPGMGSLIAEVGLITAADRKSTPGSGPVWYTTPYGVAPGDYQAEYSLRDFGSASTPVLSMGILDAGTGQGSIAVVDDNGAGLRILHNRATGNVAVAIIGTTPVQAWSVPLGSNRRVAAYLQRTGAGTQSVRLRMEDGTEYSYAGTTDLAAGWAATRVVVDTDIPLGWWIVENNKPVSQRWDTLHHTPSARFRVGDHGFLQSSRDIYLDDAAEWTQQQIDAECSTMWLDEDGVMQYAGRDVLDDQSLAQTITTRRDVDDVQWETRGRRMSRNLSLTYEKPHVVADRNGRVYCTVWEGSASDLAPGEEDVMTVNVPTDQDWFGVDTNPHHIQAWGQAWDYYVMGSTFGGTQYTAASSDNAAWAAFLNCTMTRVNNRTYEVTFSPWPSMSSTHRVNSDFPPTSTSAARSNRSALVMRSRAIATWNEVESLTEVNPAGRGTYTHSVGWRVQNAGGALTALRVWLSGIVGGKPQPVATSTIAHDPRRQIGDLLRIQDTEITGADFDQLVQGRRIQISDSEFTDTITGRVTLVRTTYAPGSRPVPAGHTALTPASDWTRRTA